MKLKKISIIGVGLMGGSLALALKEAYPKSYLWGYARSSRSFKKLKKLKITDVVTSDLEKLVSNSDLVILAVPVLTIADYFSRIAPFLKKRAVVIDIGSTKAFIEKEAKKNLPRYVDFVGSHPLCGSSKHGPENAVAGLYKGSVCIVTSANKSVNFVINMWKKLGAKVYVMDPAVHDKILSYVSHLPHVISYSLSLAVPLRYMPFSSRSFSDITRISSSLPDSWVDIFLSNKKHIVKNIDEYMEILKLFKNLIKSQDRKAIIRLIRKVNSKHNKFH